MYKELAKDGLIVISLSVDEPDNKAKALEFLKKNNAVFPNYWLDDSDENKEKWEKKLAHSAPPVMHIFDKSGTKVKTIEEDMKPEELEKLIKDLLSKK